MRRRAYLATTFVGLVLAACSNKVEKIIPPEPAPLPGAGEQVVKLLPTKVRRMSEMRITFNNGVPDMHEPHPINLKKGSLTVDDETVTFYIPERGPYSVSSAKNHHFDNTSTAFSVDADNDSDLQRTELWYSSLPIRMGNKMFDVKKIDPGGTWVLLAQSAAPLAGLVVGKPCPDFKLVMNDGKTITPADYKDRVLLLDVWSFT
jgi:hypothetical protein